MNLPAGTVTLLFTDIEGSTRLWESHPETMQAALARHDVLLRDAIESSGGHVFKTVGDAFCAVFHTAPEALSATLSAQLAIAGESWPEETPIKVRMALHTGAVESRDNDYFGPPLNRVARLLSTGHGGQTLLSLATCDLVRDSLPEQTTLKDLGAHQLKDLTQTEQVFQLQNPDLPDKFPPIKSLSTHPNNLPKQVTSFIGRGKELSEAEELLQKTRLLTLTGSGGSGKSRLSLQLAADILENFPDGAFLVELAPLSDPSFVAQAVASILGLQEEQGKPILVTLTEHLKSKKLLFLLDNCEHVLDSSAKLAEAIIRNCPGVKILATSREGLGIAGELTYRIPSLSTPSSSERITLENFSQYESIQLFVDRAIFHRSDFAVTDANAPALASICFRLDGIPLAIELAAARVRSLSLEEINSKLDQRFRLLTGGSRTALPRQQTLRSLIDWSYDLLRAEEKRVLERLSVFAGGWTMESAEAVCVSEEIEDWEILDYLTSLCDKSLVLAEQKQGRTRYRYLETVRQYTRERLLDSGEGEGVREKHRAFFLTLAEEAQPKLQSSEQAEWLERLDVEHENLRTALDGSLSSADSLEALRFCGALHQFWWTRGHLSEGQAWCRQALDKPGAEKRTGERANTLIGVGVMAYIQGDYPSANVYLAESLAIQREVGNKDGIAKSLNNLGNVAFYQGFYPTAMNYYHESLEIYRELNNKTGISNSLNNLGNITSFQYDYSSARIYLEESLIIQRISGNEVGLAASLVNLSDVALNQGDYASSRAYLEESLVIRHKIGHKNGIASNLRIFGATAGSENQAIRAATLWGAAEALCEEIGAPIAQVEQEPYEKDVTAARAALSDDAAFHAAWQEGRALTLEEAIALALDRDTDA